MFSWKMPNKTKSNRKDEVIAESDIPLSVLVNVSNTKRYVVEVPIGNMRPKDWIVVAVMAMMCTMPLSSLDYEFLEEDLIIAQGPGGQGNHKPLPSLDSTLPEITAQGTPDGKGYEWYTDAKETSWYRNEGSNSEWQRFDAWNYRRVNCEVQCEVANCQAPRIGGI